MNNQPTARSAEDRLRSARTRILLRKLHNYLGLYLLTFVWLFAASGLILNHPAWSAAQFWKAREETTAQRAIIVPRATGDVELAAGLMTQLGIVGEIGETKRSSKGDAFEFQVVRPGRVFRVEARIDSALARVTQIRLNAWGVLDALHKFTGVSLDAPARTRDWALTTVWSLAMDALALGLMILVASGLFLWYRFPAKRVPGLVALGAGMACCGFFLFGLGTLFG
ncbi:MAG: hypothetical protein ABI625_27040 [bacterium]